MAAEEARHKADRKSKEKAHKAIDKANAQREKRQEARQDARDTLSEIGQRYGVDWHEIGRINNVEDPNRIFPGQKFKIAKK